MKNYVTKLFALLVLALGLITIVGCKEQEVKDPQFNVPETLSVVEGNTTKITPADVENVESFSYLSLSENVATVDQTGLVTGLIPGTAIIVVAGGDLQKNVKIVVDPNLVNGLRVKDLDAIAAFGVNQSNVEAGSAHDVLNFGWATEGFSPEILAAKMDFDGSASADKVILRGVSSTEKHSTFINGEYAIVMAAGINVDLTAANNPEGAHAQIYGKYLVSDRANGFRIWAASWNDDTVSGMGSFRVVALVKNGSVYEEIKLVAADIGELTQDNNGWISYDNTTGDHIDKAPDHNMFVFQVKNEKYDLTGKEIIISIDFRALPNTLGENQKNKQSRFGIKRLGFTLDPEPSFSIANGAEAEIILGETLQLALNEVGAVLPENYQFTSSDSSIASVNTEGVITAKALGQVTITVKNGDLEKKIVINVIPVPQASFNLPEGATVAYGSTYQIVPLDVVSVETFTYEIISPLATVNETGLVTPKLAGFVNIKVTGDDLVKYMTLTITAPSIYGLDNTRLKDMVGFSADQVNIATDGNPLNFVPGWGAAGANADKISLDDSATLDTAIIRTSIPSGYAVINVEENWLDIINGLSEAPELPVTALYFKAVVPDAPNFRVWTYSPTKNEVISGAGMFRVVYYLPNDDYTSFTAYSLGFNFQEQENWATTQLENGFVKYSNGLDGFFAFSVPEELKGKTVIVVIESWGQQNDEGLQDRFAIKRMGFI